MTSEKEINDALAIVREAAREDRIEVEVDGRWQTKCLSFNGYRAKPEPREFWICWDHVKDVGDKYTERPDACVYPLPQFDNDSLSHFKNVIKVREVL